MKPGRSVKSIWWASDHGESIVNFDRGDCVLIELAGDGAMVLWAQNYENFHRIGAATSVELWPVEEEPS